MSKPKFLSSKNIKSEQPKKKKNLKFAWDGIVFNLSLLISALPKSPIELRTLSLRLGFLGLVQIDQTKLRREEMRGGIRREATAGGGNGM